MSGRLAAVDLGASSGRVMLGRVGPDTLELHRGAPVPQRAGAAAATASTGTCSASTPDVLDGLRAAARDRSSLGRAWPSTPGPSTTGCSTRDGALLGNPRHYRDAAHRRRDRRGARRVDPARLYGAHRAAVPAVQHALPARRRARRSHGRRALLIPDLLGYWLTGRQVAEETNASTTGLLDARTGDWSRAADRGARAAAGPAARRRSRRAGRWPRSPPTSARSSGVDYALPVTTVGSHDTASAVVGVPAENERFGYISCGTWGLVGVELDAPVLTEDSRRANFTNERGVDGTIRYLRNVMGLWLLSESMRTWNLRGLGVDLGDVLLRRGRAARRAARASTPTTRSSCRPATCPRGSSRPAGLRAARARDVAEIVRCILDSLAVAFAADDRADAERLSGRPIEVVHLVGGGSQNALLCQLTADACGRPVVAGPGRGDRAGQPARAGPHARRAVRRPGRAARAGARGEPPAPLRAEVTAVAALLLPAPGAARAAGRVPRAPPRGVAGDARRAARHRAGATTRSSSAPTAS